MQRIKQSFKVWHTKRLSASESFSEKKDIDNEESCNVRDMGSTLAVIIDDVKKHTHLLLSDEKDKKPDCVKNYDQLCNCLTKDSVWGGLTNALSLLKLMSLKTLCALLSESSCSVLLNSEIDWHQWESKTWCTLQNSACRFVDEYEEVHHRSTVMSLLTAMSRRSESLQLTFWDTCRGHKNLKMLAIIKSRLTHRQDKACVINKLTQCCLRQERNVCSSLNC